MSRGYMDTAKTVEWETPAALFESLDREFGFTLDAAATPQNAKCARFFTVEDDGLAMDWDAPAVWCNPPYGRELPKWVRKGAKEVEEGRAGRVVMLIPARTDTAVFQDVIFKKASRVEFLRGRVRFGGGVPHPSRLASWYSADRSKVSGRRIVRGGERFGEETVPGLSPLA